MGELSQADRYLLEGIRQGDADAWSQLVDRYRGRLLAFARSRLGRDADAEDVLQETFMRFLRALPGYRAQASLETYLFTILRRRLVDFFRGRRQNVCLLQDVVRPRGEEESPGPMAEVASPDPSASWVVQRDEQDHLRRDALASAIRKLINAYKKSLNFRDLKIVEMLFYCQLPNKEVADAAGVAEKQVGQIKHRCLKRVRRQVAQNLKSPGAPPPVEGRSVHADAMLTDVWETLRLSCPKRSTIGAYLLGTLDGAWQEYVHCHLHKLGCRFCLANLEDLKGQTSDETSSALRDRILQSTVGFLRQSYLGKQGG